MLALLEIELESRADCPLPHMTGHLVHGLLFRQLKKENAQFASRVHDDIKKKPFTVSPLYPLGGLPGAPVQALAAGGRVAFRVGLMDDETAKMTVAAMNSADAADVTVGKSPFRVKGVRVLDTVRPEEITGCGGIEKGFSLRFRTPTCFKSSGRVLLLPEPRLLLASLARAWEKTGSAPLDLERVNRLCESVLPMQYRLETGVMRMDKYFIPGFVGICSFRMIETPSDEEKQALAKLLAIVPFAGIGYKTAMGMGQATVGEVF